MKKIQFKQHFATISQPFDPKKLWFAPMLDE